MAITRNIVSTTLVEDTPWSVSETVFDLVLDGSATSLAVSGATAIPHAGPSGRTPDNIRFQEMPGGTETAATFTSAGLFTFDTTNDDVDCTFVCAAGTNTKTIRVKMICEFRDNAPA